MKHIVRRGAAAAAALAALTALAGCRSDTPSMIDTDTGAAESLPAVTTEAPYAGPYLTLAEGKDTAYSIVYPEGCVSSLVEAAQSFRAWMRETGGARPDCGSDLLPAWMDAPESDFEILIGRTNRAASEAAYASLTDASDYIITVSGNSLVVVGGSDEATLEALALLTDSDCIEQADGTLRVRGDLAVARVTSYFFSDAALSADGQYLSFTLASNTGIEQPCRVSFQAGGWRIQCARADGSYADGAGQMLARFFDETPLEGGASLTAAIDGTITLTEPDGSRLVLTAAPFSIVAYTPSGREAAEITALSVGSTTTVVRGTLTEDEAIFGTGERFNSVNQRGKTIDMTAIDIWAGIEGNSYMPIPTLISSRGSGMFVNRYERMILDLGATDDNLWEIELYDAPLDLYLFPTENPADVLYGYSRITGFSPEPADWMYGTAVCRYAPEFSTKEGIYAMVDAMAENDFPWDTVILEGWNAYTLSKWNELTEVVDTLHAMGKKVLVYTTTGRTKGTSLPSIYNVLRADTNSPDLPDTDNYNPVDNPSSDTSRYVDITSADAWSWWRTSLWDRLVNKVGVDGAKIDFCEQFPDYLELIFEDDTIGTSGAHHWYPTFYNTLMYNLFNEKEDGGMVLARGGGIGAQRYPFIWAGDQRREFQYLEAQLKACLSAGMSGVPFMSFDMAGYKPAQNGDNEAKVFTRGIEFTAFTANIQTHGNVSRPYDFDDDAKDIYRDYAYVHEALRPYLEEQGVIATETGMPLMRHLALLYWTDETVWDIDDEYMLGEGLLVCPVLSNAVKRDIYLPEGQWQHYLTGEIYEGGRWLRDYAVAWDEIPVFVKVGCENTTLSTALTEIRTILGE